MFEEVFAVPLCVGRICPFHRFSRYFSCCRPILLLFSFLFVRRYIGACKKGVLPLVPFVFSEPFLAMLLTYFFGLNRLPPLPPGCEGYISSCGRILDFSCPRLGPPRRFIVAKRYSVAGEGLFGERVIPHNSWPTDVGLVVAILPLCGVSIPLVRPCLTSGKATYRFPASGPSDPLPHPQPGPCVFVSKVNLIFSSPCWLGVFIGPELLPRSLFFSDSVCKMSRVFFFLGSLRLPLSFASKSASFPSPGVPCFCSGARHFIRLAVPFKGSFCRLFDLWAPFA